MTDSAIAIQTSGLSKRFPGGFRSKGVKALDNVNLEVRTGEVFGLLGPNGAGKTTLVKILLGSLRPTAGSASIDGYDCNRWQARQRVGFLPENHRFPVYQTGLQMMYFFGGMAGLSKSEIRTRADRLLDLVEMTRWRKTKIKKYSKGMMQRLGLAQALLNDPDLIFLDEPTDGVDPIGRHEIRNILLELKKQGKTIFLNSHLLAEVESVCDRVAVLDKGKLIKSGPATGLIGAAPGYQVETCGLSDEINRKLTEAFPQIIMDGNTITISLEDARRINTLIDFLRQHQVDLVAVRPQKMSLEESFMQLVRGNTGNE